ncbi:ATP synthase subunit mitochondrial, partial [Brachionus plicatilis]
TKKTNSQFNSLDRSLKMFGAVSLMTPVYTQARGYATLKDISMRLKSVKNIQKITKSMKMVSAAKYAKAEKDLKATRPYGEATSVFSEQAEVPTEPENVKKHLVVAVTSDRGLCGAIHTSIVKAVKALLAEEKYQNLDTKIVCIGDKSKTMLQRVFASNILFSVNDVGKKNVSFMDASLIANGILNSGYEFDSGEILYNRFKTAISYTTTNQPFYSSNLISSAKNIGVYDSLDAETIKCYQEYQLASMVFYALKENSTSELSSRMSAMDNASKNAGEMIDKLTLYYNRTRQAVITRELIEIISGASALDAKE